MSEAKEKFYHYPSLAKDDGSLEFLRSEGGTCEVTEKIHGANLQVTVDSTGVRVGRRKAYLGQDENFYNMQEWAESHKSVFVGLLNETPGSVVALTLYGEAFGHYRHKCVQKEFDYGTKAGAKHADFIAFDLMIRHKDGSVHFVDAPHMREVMIKVGLPSVPVLFRGTLDECLTFSRENVNRRSAWGGDHVREGHVIRSEDGDVLDEFGARVLYKHKGDAFLEVHHMKKKKVTSHEMSPHLVKAYETLCTGATLHRFNSVKSKENEDMQKNIGLMIHRLRDDIFEDMPNVVKTLDSKDVKCLRRKVAKFVGPKVREWV